MSLARGISSRHIQFTRDHVPSQLLLGTYHATSHNKLLTVSCRNDSAVCTDLSANMKINAAIPPWLPRLGRLAKSRHMDVFLQPARSHLKPSTVSLATYVRIARSIPRVAVHSLEFAGLRVSKHRVGAYLHGVAAAQSGYERELLPTFPIYYGHNFNFARLKSVVAGPAVLERSLLQFLTAQFSIPIE